MLYISNIVIFWRLRRAWSIYFHTGYLYFFTRSTFVPILKIIYGWRSTTTNYTMTVSNVSLKHVAALQIFYFIKGFQMLLDFLKKKVIIPACVIIPASPYWISCTNYLSTSSFTHFTKIIWLEPEKAAWQSVEHKQWKRLFIECLLGWPGMLWTLFDISFCFLSKYSAFFVFKLMFRAIL